MLNPHSDRPVPGSCELERRSTTYLLMMLGMLILAACSPTPTPSPTADATATATARPELTSTTTPEAPPVSPTMPPATATPSGEPTRPSPTPRPQPEPSYDQALRPAFRSDDDRFPRATRYRLDLALDHEAATLSGRQHVSYTNTEDVVLDTLYLRLFPNTAGYAGEMSVTNLARDGQEVESLREELRGSALRVPLEPALPPGAATDLTLHFTLALSTEGHPAGSQEVSEGYRQLGTYDGVTALANAFPIIPVYDDEGWNVELAPSYGDAVFSDVAFFDVSITAPATMTLAASGTCTMTETSAARATWTCVAAPMRDFNVILGEDYQVESRNVDGITVNSVFYDGHQDGGIAALDYASRAVQLFNAQIGPYPFTELDVVETPTLAGGIEYPALVVINESYYGRAGSVGDRMEWVVVHEVLHQWWYSLVGNDQVDEPWLDEALVQYCTLLYYEEAYGQDVAARLLESMFQQAYEELQETGRDQPVGLPVAGYAGYNYGPIVYQKGPLYFHQLRQRVGIEAFWGILATYFERGRYGIARPADWIAAVEAVTGSEHRALYDAWIQGTDS